MCIRDRITRAKKLLFFSYTEFREGGYNPSNGPSRFLSEIPDEMIEGIKSETASKSNYHSSISKPSNKKYFFKVGQRVRHVKFGEGIIQRYEGARDDLKLHINFDSYGYKVLVLNYSNLEFL